MCLTLSDEAKDAYWAAAVTRTEEMLDGIYARIKAESFTRGKGFHSSTRLLFLVHSSNRPLRSSTRQLEPFLTMKTIQPLNVSHQKCSCQAEIQTHVSP